LDRVSGPSASPPPLFSGAQMVASDLNKTNARVVVAAQGTPAQQAASPVCKSRQLNPASPVAAAPAAMRARLGQRGGVVKMSDGFEVFYGLVGDQPVPANVEVRSSVKSTAPALAAPPCASKPKQLNKNGSVATSLAHRGGFVRKSDGFEVFYGLVGDQPESGEAGQAEASAGAAECRNSDLGNVVLSDGQVATRLPSVDSAAMFSLATPAASYAPVSSHVPTCGDLRLHDREQADAVTWLGAPTSDGAQQRPADVFCMATPATSFAPVVRFGECETAIPEENAALENVTSTGIPAQQIEQLGVAAVRLQAAAAKVSQKSTTGNVQPASAIADILERMGQWKPLDFETPILKAGTPQEESNPGSTPKTSNLAGETAAEKLKLAKQRSKSFDNSGLESRLASLDDAIVRLRTLQ